MRRHLLVIAAAFALAGCSTAGPTPGVASLTSGNTPTTSASTSDSDAEHRYVECMRQQGIDVQESQGGGSGSGNSSLAPNVDQQKTQAAMEKCRQYLPSSGTPGTLDQGQMDKLLAQAKCMREHGVNVADPTPGQQLGNLSAGPGVTPDQFDAAFKACQGAGR
jgi:hypothetical protein